GHTTHPYPAPGPHPGKPTRYPHHRKKAPGTNRAAVQRYISSCHPRCFFFYRPNGSSCWVSTFDIFLFSPVTSHRSDSATAPPGLPQPKMEDAGSTVAKATAHHPPQTLVNHRKLVATIFPPPDVGGDDRD
ncbi:unnamed protein product, partial [Laminaria digitata]